MNHRARRQPRPLPRPQPGGPGR